MSKISKQIANDIAIKLTEKQEEKIKALKEELNNFVIAEHEKSVPEIVKEGFLRYPSYYENNNINIIVNGSHYGYFKVRYPRKEHYFQFEDANKGNEFVKLINKINKLKDGRNDLQNEIVTTLINLSSFSKIKECFPEAYELIPEKKYLPAINVDDLRNRLNSEN